MGCAQQRTSCSVENQTKDKPDSLFFLFQKCQRTYDYSPMLSFLEDRSRDESVIAFPSWADPPLTRNAAAMAVLNSSEAWIDLAILTAISPTIVKVLTHKNQSLNHHLMHFLSKNIPKSRNKFTPRLLNCSVLAAIIPFILDENKEFRLCTVKVCKRLCSYGKEARTQFFEGGGVSNLAVMMKMDERNSKSIKAIIGCVIALLGDEDEETVRNFTNHIVKTADYGLMKRVIEGYSNIAPKIMKLKNLLR